MYLSVRHCRQIAARRKVPLQVLWWFIRRHRNWPLVTVIHCQSAPKSELVSARSHSASAAALLSKQHPCLNSYLTLIPVKATLVILHRFLFRRVPPASKPVHTVPERECGVGPCEILVLRDIVIDPAASGYRSLLRCEIRQLAELLRWWQ